MIQQEQPAASASSAPITTFEAQQGAPIPEMHSGARLLVTAYVVIWVIAMVFVQLTWLRQRRLAKRVDELERKLDARATDDDAAEERMAQTVVKDRPKREMD